MILNALDIICIVFSIVVCPFVFANIRKVGNLRKMQLKEKISFIIINHNKAMSLKKLLANLMSNWGRTSEIIVVDMHSKDHSIGIVRGYGVKLVEFQKNPYKVPDKIYAQFLGAEQAKGDILVFLDSGIILSPHSLFRIRSALRGNNAVSVFPYYKYKGYEGVFSGLLHTIYLMYAGAFYLYPTKGSMYSEKFLCMQRKTYYSHFCIKDNGIDIPRIKPFAVKIRAYLGYPDVLYLCDSNEFGKRKNKMRGIKEYVHVLPIVFYIFGGISIASHVFLSVFSMSTSTVWIILYILFSSIYTYYLSKFGNYPILSGLAYPISFLYVIVDSLKTALTKGLKKALSLRLSFLSKEMHE